MNEGMTHEPLSSAPSPPLLTSYLIGETNKQAISPTLNSAQTPELSALGACSLEASRVFVTRPVPHPAPETPNELVRRGTQAAALF